MSVKAHDGHRLSVSTMNERWGTVQSVIEPVLCAEQTKLMAEWIARRRFDNELKQAQFPSSADTPGTGSALADVVIEFQLADARLRAPNARREPELDLVTSAVFWKDPTDPTMMLVMPGSEHERIRSALMSALDATPFAYWDNTDPDPDVTGDEWDRRRAAWLGTASAPTLRLDVTAPFIPNTDEVARSLLAFGGRRLGLTDLSEAQRLLSQPIDAPMSPERTVRFRPVLEAFEDIGPFPGLDADWHGWVFERNAILEKHLGSWSETGPVAP